MALIDEESASPVSRLLAHLRTPLYRNGYALVLSSASTSAFGVVYWILAARLYSPQVIGLNSAAISAMMFLSGVAQLNLTSALIRFIPVAGRLTRRFVFISYIVSLVVALLASGVFILGTHLWAPSLEIFSSHPVLIFWFILSTMAWCIFAFQDSVLTGLHYATWVPVDNTVFALTKIALLVVFATSIPQLGVFASWTLGMFTSMVPTTIYIFWRLIPKQLRASDRPGWGQVSQDLDLQKVVSFAATDYLGALFWMVSTMFLPVIVAAMVGVTANATFYLTWTIAYSLYLVSTNVGSSFIVEASSNPGNSGAYSYKAFKQIARLVVPVVLILTIGAPVVLRIFGEHYVAAGTPLLRLLVLSAIPNIVTALYVSVLRVQRRMHAVVITLGILAGLVLTMSYLLLPMIGVLGVGVAWLAAQTLVAIVIYATQLRPLWEGVNAADIRPFSIPFKKSTRNHKEYSPFLAKIITWLVRLVNWSGIQPGLLGLLKRPGKVLARRRNQGQMERLVPVILNTVGPLPGLSHPERWTSFRPLRTVTDMTVFLVGPTDSPPVAVLKMPRSVSAMLSSRQQSAVLEVLHNDPRLADWGVRIPIILAEREAAGQPFSIEELLPGQNGLTALSNSETRVRFLMAASSIIDELHRRTATTGVVDSRLISVWVDEPLLLVRQAILPILPDPLLLTGLDRLADRLKRSLLGKEFTLSWVHGDYVPENILVGTTGNWATGIVDWELARPNELPILDQLQLLLSTWMRVHRMEMGDVVLAHLNGGGWAPYERRVVDATREIFPIDPLDLRDLVLLAWLRHVTANLTKSTRYTGKLYWIIRNIEVVLKAL